MTLTCTLLAAASIFFLDYGIAVWLWTFFAALGGVMK